MIKKLLGQQIMFSRKIRSVCLAAMVALAGVLAAQNPAHSKNYITFKQASKTGQLKITFINNDKNAQPSGKHEVVIGVTKGDSALKTSSEILRKFNETFPTFGDCTVASASELQCEKTTIEITQDTSDSTGSLGKGGVQKAQVAVLDASFAEPASTLAGIDSNGGESTFFASLGFKTKSVDVSAATQFTFSQIGGNSLDDWLSKIYTGIKGQLPFSFQNQLALDLDNNIVTFNFPDDQIGGSAFASNQATDLNGGTSTKLPPVPAPFSLLGFAAAMNWSRKLRVNSTRQKPQSGKEG